jgi:hypothetical protein
MQACETSGLKGKSMTENKKTCQVCRLRPAEKQVRTSDGRVMWRCNTCHDLKNRAGFTKGKQ